VAHVVLDPDCASPPGSHTVQFLVVALTTVSTSMPVQVQRCGPGEVTVPGWLQYFRSVIGSLQGDQEYMNHEIARHSNRDVQRRVFIIRQLVIGQGLM
jgi:hypothetical protein